MRQIGCPEENGGACLPNDDLARRPTPTTCSACLRDKSSLQLQHTSPFSLVVSFLFFRQQSNRDTGRVTPSTPSRFPLLTETPPKLEREPSKTSAYTLTLWSFVQAEGSRTAGPRVTIEVIATPPTCIRGGRGRSKKTPKRNPRWDGRFEMRLQDVGLRFLRRTPLKKQIANSFQTGVQV